MKPEKQVITESEIHATQLTNVTLLEAYRILTPAECRVLEKLVSAEGKTNYEIAEVLFMSPKSLENYITKIGAKLGLYGKGKLKEWATLQINKTWM